MKLLRAFTRRYARINGVSVGPDEEVVIRFAPCPPPEELPVGRFSRDGELLGDILAGIVPAGTTDRAISKVFQTSVMGEGELLDSAFIKARLGGAPVEEAVRAALGPAVPEALVRWVAKFARRAEGEI